MENQDSKKSAQIQLRDSIPGGEYANNMRVAASKEEFLLMFDNIVAGSGRVVSKVIVTPGHLKRIVKLLEEQLKTYEQQFGIIEEAKNPKDELGFRS